MAFKGGENAGRILNDLIETKLRTMNKTRGTCLTTKECVEFNRFKCSCWTKDKTAEWGISVDMRVVR